MVRGYTTIEQSRKLAEILPIESADMGLYYSSNPNAARNQMWVGTKAENANIPCWSLAVLLSILPNSIYDNTDEYSQLEFSKISVAYHDMNGGIKLGSIKDNLVDACYEMIIKLHEKNLL